MADKYTKGGVIKSPTKPAVAPSTLGTGLAASGAKKALTRKQKQQAMLDELSGKKPKP